MKKQDSFEKRGRIFNSYLQSKISVQELTAQKTEVLSKRRKKKMWKSSNRGI